jgi:hypothetical protein
MTPSAASHPTNSAAGTTQAFGRLVLLRRCHAGRSCLGARLRQTIFGNESSHLFAGVLGGRGCNQKRESTNKNKDLYHRIGSPQARPGLCMSCRGGAIAFAAISLADTHSDRQHKSCVNAP